MSEKKLLVIRKDLPDKPIQRGTIGWDGGSDACLVRVRMRPAGQVVPVLPGNCFCPNGDPSLCSITSVLQKYSDAVDFTDRDDGLPKLFTARHTWKNDVGFCERELRRTWQAMQGPCPKAADELAKALKLFADYRANGVWPANGEDDFLRHVGCAILEISGL